LPFCCKNNGPAFPFSFLRRGFNPPSWLSALSFALSGSELISYISLLLCCFPPIFSLHLESIFLRSPDVYFPPTTTTLAGLFFLPQYVSKMHPAFPRPPLGTASLSFPRPSPLFFTVYRRFSFPVFSILVSILCDGSEIDFEPVLRPPDVCVPLHFPLCAPLLGSPGELPPLSRVPSRFFFLCCIVCLNTSPFCALKNLFSLVLSWLPSWLPVFSRFPLFNHGTYAFFFLLRSGVVHPLRRSPPPTFHLLFRGKPVVLLLSRPNDFFSLFPIPLSPTICPPLGVCYKGAFYPPWRPPSSPCRFV